MRNAIFVFFVGLSVVCLTASSAVDENNRPLSSSERLLAIAPAAPGELRLTPTFASCSVKFGAEADGKPVLEYRSCGNRGVLDGIIRRETPWRRAIDPHYFADVKEFRGSLLELEEGTSYEVRLRSGETVLASGCFTTWATKIPIARTVELDPATVRFPVVVSDRGTPGGWIRYTAKGPLVHCGTGDHFTVSNAAYVVFDNMDLSGGSGGHVFNLRQSENIRLRNLDIHDWGQVGVPSYTEHDLGRIVRKPGAWAVNDQAVFLGRGMRNTVVERCWIHDQNSRSVAWYYSHPYGQNAVTMAFPEEGTVLRWNDFIGSDEHRWNDAVTGYGNFREDGGFHRDADIYGNYMCFAGDDGIELDGGQQNIRCWGNRFDSSYTGVSVQGNTVSPSFVWRNWFGPCVDEFGLRGATLKTSGVEKGAKGDCVTYIWSNTLGGGGWGEPIFLRRGVKFRLWDNLALHAEKPWSARKPEDEEGTVFLPDTATPGAVKPGERQEMWPLRPLPFVLDALSVDLGKAHTSAVIRTVWTSARDETVDFKVVWNSAFDWFEVTPREGRIGKDGVTFTVRYTGKEPTRRFLRGVFLVRTKYGLSRPCGVRAETDFTLPLKCHRPGEFADYRTNLNPDADGWFSASFDVPKDGTYYFLVRGVSGAPVVDGRARPELEVSVDGSPAATSVQQADLFTTWTMLTPGRKFGHMIRQYDFKAGTHTVRFRLAKNRFDIEALVLTDAPGSFERR